MKLLMENWRGYLKEEAEEDLSKMGVYLSDSYIIIYNYLGVLANIRKMDEQIKPFIVGAARLGFREKAFTVEEIWAKKGYGPVLYRLALEQAGRYGLTPSRIRGEVSDAASNVWKNFYDGAGSQYVTHKPTELKPHDVEHLDAIYFSDGPRVNKRKPQANHEKIFSKKKDPYEERINHFLETVDSKLRSEVGQT